MILVGLDCDSSKIGYAYFRDDILWRTGIIRSHDKDVNGRQFELYSQLHEMFETCRPDKVILEQSFFSNNFRTSRAITEVIGSAKIVCQLFDIPFETVQVTQWKKATVGNGRAKKEDILQYVELNFKVDDNISQDEADAVLICLYGVLNEKEKHELLENNNNSSIKEAGRDGGNNSGGATC